MFVHDWSQCIVSLFTACCIAVCTWLVTVCCVSVFSVLYRCLYRVRVGRGVLLLYVCVCRSGVREIEFLLGKYLQGSSLGRYWPRSDRDLVVVFPGPWRTAVDRRWTTSDELRRGRWTGRPRRSQVAGSCQSVGGALSDVPSCSVCRPRTILNCIQQVSHCTWEHEIRELWV